MTDWRKAYWDLIEGRPTEVRLNDDDTLDEIVGFGGFRLEQMDDNFWFLDLAGTALFIRGKKVRLRPRDHDSWVEQKAQSENGLIDIISHQARIIGELTRRNRDQALALQAMQSGHE